MKLYKLAKKSLCLDEGHIDERSLLEVDGGFSFRQCGTKIERYPGPDWMAGSGRSPKNR